MLARTELEGPLKKGSKSSEARSVCEIGGPPRLHRPDLDYMYMQAEIDALRHQKMTPALSYPTLVLVVL